MAKCDVCGNNYDKSFEVRMAGKTYTFDSFECAIHRAGAGVRTLRMQDHRARRWRAEGRMFCCATCAEHSGVPEMVDRVPETEERV